MPDTLIVSELEVDDPLVMDANYRFGTADRKYIDDQVRGCEQHLVDCLIRGVRATYARLHSSSPLVTPGDTVCLTTPTGTATEVTVTKCTASSLESALTIYGVVLRAAAPGGFVLVAYSGAVPPSVTGLPTNKVGYARVNTTTGRCELVDSTSSVDFAVGSVAIGGWLEIVTQNQNGVVSIGTADNTPTRIRRYPIADSTVMVIRAIIKVQNAAADKYGEYEVKSAFRRSSGSLAQLYAPEIIPIIESDANLDVTVTLNGNTDVDINVVGLPATSLIWTASEMFL